VRYDFPRKDGSLESVECIQYVVVGHNSEWPDYMRLSEFKDRNPELKLEAN